MRYWTDLDDHDIELSDTTVDSLIAFRWANEGVQCEPALLG